MRNDADSATPSRAPRRKRIGVLLPAGCRGEALELAVNHAIMLKLGSAAAGEDAEVVVSRVEGESDALGNIRRLTDNGIAVRAVGTPSVMSRIPAVLEMVRDPVLQDAMLFDPYDGESIGERVRWALANRSLLLEMQRPLYDEMARRDWRVAASEYAALFAKLAASP